MNDWQYNRHRRQWELVSGDWLAVVMRADVGDTWHPTVERRGAQPEHYDGPDATWPHEGRVWCEAEIARLRDETP